MRIEDLHDFFVAAASVAGALIGLLFVAVSVSQQRLTAQHDSAIHRVRASAALASFTNALIVSLFGLVPRENIGDVGLAVSCVGLVSVLAMVLSLVRARTLLRRSAIDVIFVAGLAVLFVVQLTTALQIRRDHDAGSGLQNLAVLVVVCFLVGIARSWELIGGPHIGLFREAKGLGEDLDLHVRRERDERDDA